MNRDGVMLRINFLVFFLFDVFESLIIEILMLLNV